MLAARYCASRRSLGMGRVIFARFCRPICCKRIFASVAAHVCDVCVRTVSYSAACRRAFSSSVIVSPRCIAAATSWRSPVVSLAVMCPVWGERTYPEVPRVHLHGVRHVARDAHEFRQHERALLRPLLCEDELHRRRVHAVAQRRDHTEVSDGKQSVELVLLYRLVAVGNLVNTVMHNKRRDILVMHRDEVERTILAVDMRDELRHLPLELRRVGQCGRRHLDEDDVPDPLRIVLQELLECAQLGPVSASPHPVLRGRPTFCTTPLTTSSLSRPTMIFLPSYSARRASSFG